MIKQLLTLCLALQLLGGIALADKTTFVDGNAATRSPGTRVTATFLNAVNLHRHDGKNVDGSGVLDYAHDTGAANAIAITLAPALVAHVEGMPVYLKVASPNTGPTTLAINGLAPVEIVHRDGSSMAAGDLLANQIIGVAYNGSHYQLTLYEPPLVTNVLTVGGQTAAQLSPPGALQAFAMPTSPVGWLPCDGRVVSRTTYAALFAAIGSTWGAGDNVTTFHLPDLRGEFLRGWDNGRGIDTGRVFGAEQLDAQQPIAGTLATSNGGTGPFQENGISVSAFDKGGSATGTTFDSSLVVRTAPENRPRNIAIFYAIKY